MIEHRARGSELALAMAVIGGNACLYVGMLLAEYAMGWVGMLPRAQNYVYLAAIPVAWLMTYPLVIGATRVRRGHVLLFSFLAALRFSVFQGAAIFTVYFFLKDVGVSRFFLLVYLGCGLILNTALLALGPTGLGPLLFGRRDRLRAVLYGEGALPEQLAGFLEEARAMGIEVMGYYADESLHMHTVEWLGTREQVMTCEGGRKRLRLDVVFAYGDFAADERFRSHMDRCMQGGARVHIYAAVADRFGDPVKLVSDGSVQFLTFFDEPLQNPLNIFMKRSLDLAVAVPVVLFLLPPLAVLVWLIHVAQSPGPLFFRQQRYGMNRRAFTIIKFRSMHVQDRNHEAEQARKGDKRVFALGAILRKTSIDEFPQFLNVLRGDMSVVGPRPHLTLHDAEFEKFHERYRARHFVKPGITGLAQIKGFRGEIQNEAAILGRVELDHRYISEWNIGKDLLIIIRTIWQVFFPPKSAY